MNPSRLFSRGHRFVLAAAFLAVMQGCASCPMDDADARAAAASMQRHEITAGSFRMTTYSRIRDTNQPLTIYIDGDVRGWTPSADPGVDSTPDDYLGLRLATLDPSINVLYIAHPCQFGIDDPVCFDESWQSGPYARQILASINRTIDHTTVVFPHPQLNLVGYSGGGAIAAVLAAQRHDVLSLRTIAGNLDPGGDERAHASDPQDDYINPIENAQRLSLLAQVHYVGDKDVFVPPFVTENFVKAVGPSPCLKVTHVEDATHQSGWEDFWESNATKIPTCGALAR